jgi:chromosome segregation ATPase
MTEDPGLATRLGQLQADELPLQLVALRDARQRAAETRAAAERALREAQAAEAEIAAQEEQAIAAATAAQRERLVENARVASAAEREALEILSALHVQLNTVAARKAQAEAAVVAIRVSLAEHENQLRGAEADERTLLADATAAERNAQSCMRAREQADAALNGAAPVLSPAPAPERADAVPEFAASLPDYSCAMSLREQRAAERRMADALRSASA